MKSTSLILALVLAILAIVLIVRKQSQPTISEAVREVRLTTIRDPRKAIELADEALIRFPDNIKLQHLRAEAFLAAGESKSALEWLDQQQSRLPLSDVDFSPSFIKILLTTGRHALAFRILDHQLELDPDNVMALHERAGLLLSHGRMVEARQDLQRLLDLQQLVMDEAVFLSSRREFLEDRAGLESAIQRTKSDGSVLTGLGALAAYERDNARALELLQQATASKKSVPAAWAALGKLLIELGDLDRLNVWANQVPQDHSNHPGILFVQAWRDFQHQKYQDSLRKLANVIRLDSLDREAYRLMSQIIAERSEFNDVAQQLTQRATTIHELEESSHRVLFNDYDSSLLLKIASLSAEAGEEKLAQAWYRFAQIVASRSNSALPPSPSLDQLNRISQQSSNQTASTMERLLAGDFGIRNESIQRTKNGQSQTVATVQLRDVSEQVGLDTPYFGGLENLDSGIPLAFGFGGGVAIVDIDSDQKPDLYFTQGNQWPVSRPLPAMQQDQIYRQQLGRLQNVSQVSCPEESGFGQGVSCGDFNSDGFPDLYVANIGPNRLLLNNGDGTFEAIDRPVSNARQPGWTTSCLMADIDGDGFDDLYDCHYAAGLEPLERVCHSGPDGEERGCLPTLFAPESDSLYLNDHQGGFKDVSASCGLQSASGRGLGLVLGQFDEDQALELFVSNDMTSNHLWQVEQEASIARLTESAVLSGLATNGSGQIEACMGIAAADFSGDGRCDFLVTNFFEESNTLYTAQAGGYFRDQTQISRLAAPSIKQLGFGCQALDFDLDSWSDLLVVNGHVDNYQHKNIPWKMKPSLFHNRGGENFQLAPESSLGDFGSHPALGRACARLDFDSDGRPDAVLTHLDLAPALLLNETENCGRFFTLRLVGDKSNRPGVGTQVELKVGDRVLRMQRMAGDGYYCSNEWKLHFGVGPADMIDGLTVTWPDGDRQSFQNLSVNRNALVVEGVSQLFDLSL